MRSIRIGLFAVGLLFLGVGVAAAHEPGEIGSLSAVVNSAGNWGASFWISVVDGEGKAIPVFDALAFPSAAPAAIGTPRGHLKISGELCDNFPPPIGFACKWVNMTVQSVDKTAAPEVGVYKVTAKFDASEVDENYLKKRDVSHPFLIRAFIATTRPDALGGFTTTVSSSSQVVAVLPSLKP